MVRIIDTRKRSHRLGLVAAGFMGLFLGWLLLSEVRLPPFPAEYRPLYYNSTDSLPRGLYVRIPMRPLQVGDYVIFEPGEAVERIAQERGWMRPGALFLKKVGALAGESYCVAPDTLQFTVKGEYVGQASRADKEGRPLPAIRGEQVVPEGEFLPVGTNPRSFDGRYIGTVSVGSVRALVRPLLTGDWLP